MMFVDFLSAVVALGPYIVMDFGNGV